MYQRTNAILGTGVDRRRSSSFYKPLMSKEDMEEIKKELTKKIQEEVMFALHTALGVSNGSEKTMNPKVSSKSNISGSRLPSQVQQRPLHTTVNQRRHSKVIKPVMMQEKPTFGAIRMVSRSPMPFGQRKSLIIPNGVKKDKVIVYPSRVPAQPKQVPLFPDNISEIDIKGAPNDNGLEDFAIAVEKLNQLGQPMLPPALQGLFNQLRAQAISHEEDTSNPLRDVQHLFKTVHTGTNSRSSYPGSLDSYKVATDSQIRKANKLNEDIRKAAARRSGVQNYLNTPSRQSLSIERQIVRRASRPADLFI